jgi:RsiW-degrading membrane proteinase PrsW (M82 family)
MTMNLLDYSTSSNQIDRLPTGEGVRSIQSRSKQIVFIIISSLSVAGSFIYGWLLNPEIGLLLTALGWLPLALLVFLALLIAPRSEVSLGLRLAAVFWGGVGATNLTLIIVDAITRIFGTPDLNTTVVVQAAIVEEFAKGLFLFGLFFWFKHLVRTPLAGAALGIMVGAGFAFIENIMYFNNAYLQGGWDTLWATVVLRAGMSFFLHSMATMCTGLFIGYVVSKRNTFRFWKRIIFLDMGILAAMTVHGMWNGMASLSTVNAKWNVLYICFWVPFVVIMTIAVLMVRKRYMENKAEVMVSAARRGYIRMSQAELMTNRKTRKALYKSSKSSEIIQWENSLLKVQYWNDSISTAKNERQNRKLNKAKSKDMMKLAQVVSKV